MLQQIDAAGYGPPGGPGGGYGPPPPGYGAGSGGYGPPPPLGGSGPGGFGPPGGFGGGPPGQGIPQTSGMAIASFVIGLVAFPLACCCSFVSAPFGLVALILGIVSAKQIGAEPYRYGGKGFAIAGIVLGALALLFSIALLIFGMGQYLIDQYHK